MDTTSIWIHILIILILIFTSKKALNANWLVVSSLLFFVVLSLKITSTAWTDVHELLWGEWTGSHVTPPMGFMLQPSASHVIEIIHSFAPDISMKCRMLFEMIEHQSWGFSHRSTKRDSSHAAPYQKLYFQRKGFQILYCVLLDLTHLSCPGFLSRCLSLSPSVTIISLSPAEFN